MHQSTEASQQPYEEEEDQVTNSDALQTTWMGQAGMCVYLCIYECFLYAYV